MLRSSLHFSLVVCVFLGNGCDSKNAGDPSQPIPGKDYGKQPPAPAAPVEITADQLGKEVQQDFHRTFEKYRTRELIVSGEVLGCSSYYKNLPAVSLKSSYRNLGFDVPVRCDFPKDQTSTILELGKRQKVKIRGKLVATGNEIVLNECVLVDAGTSTVQNLTAEELVKGIITGGRKAEVLYRRDTIILTGTIGSISKDKLKPERSLILGIQGQRSDGKPWRFDVHISWEKGDEYMESRVKALVVGQTIRFTGETIFPNNEQEVDIRSSQILDVK